MISFRVYGIPQTKGSTKAFMRKGMKFPVVTNDNTKNKGWSATVSGEAQRARRRSMMDKPFTGAVLLDLTFHLPRPKTLPKRVKRPTKRPDADKMVRSVMDALTGVFYKDDAQVAILHAEKQYHPQPGVTVCIEELL